MKLAVLTPHGIEGARWDSYLRKLDPAMVDVHYTVEYARVQEKLGVRPVLIVAGDPQRFILQPFVMRKTDVAGESVLDLESPYGFGGPLAHGWLDPADGYPDFWCAIGEWAVSEGIVSERSVLHPFNMTHQTWIMRRMDVGERAVTKQVVYLHLTDGEWRSRFSRNRQAGLEIARKAGASVIEVQPTHQNIDRFATLYRRTMVRNGAAPHWYFPDDYFAAHFQQFWINSRLFFGCVGTDVEVATIALCSAGTAHYHFSGSAMDHRKAEVSTLMIDTLAAWALSVGCSRLHLGGGATAAVDDSLLAFKGSFSPYRAPVSATQNVFDAWRYAHLCRKARRDPMATSFFPAYRSAA